MLIQMIGILFWEKKKKLFSKTKQKVVGKVELFYILQIF